MLQVLRACNHQYGYPFVAVSLAACVRIGVMIQAGIVQESTAKTIMESPSEGSTIAEAVIRMDRRIRYKKWLLWSRITIVVVVLQFVAATYLVLKMAVYFSEDKASDDCILGPKSNTYQWKQKLLLSFMIMVCFVAFVQCFAGSDVLRWRSFYEAHDNAWKSHYSEVFDNNLREALCCLGRVKYMSALEEDEVYSVARLLGDLVAYRASGTGHMELLAGLALLQWHRKSSEPLEECMEAPEMQIREAAALHKFAEAAYTGPLLDVGRNPFIFPCAWLYRQGVLSPWMRNRRPALDGDNWWRGHAAAFLKYVKLPPEVLRQGRVKQVKCEAAYFVLVLHHIQSVVITIRGTETPEDLITDGLCKECTLSAEDLAGLIDCSHIHSDIKERVISSFPHHGHSGIVEAARDVFNQIEGNPRERDSESCGLLSSLLGVGCECFGYDVRVVGHSLGGAIATLLGLRLHQRYPNLHVYAYGPLPCVDSVVANACSDFVTSIVFGNEFSTRLSIGSVMRLRAAAIQSLSQDANADTAMILKLARRFLYVSNYQRNKIEEKDRSDYSSGAISREDPNRQFYISHCEIGNTEDVLREFSQKVSSARKDSSKYKNPFDCEGIDEHENSSLWTDDKTKHHVVEIDKGKFPRDGVKIDDTTFCNDHVEIDDGFSNPFATDINLSDDPVSQFIDTVPSSGNKSAGDPPEMYLPGLVIHIVPEQKSSETAFWTSWRTHEKGKRYKAYVANRESFKDIIVTPSMFLDHLPWRCHEALKTLLGDQNCIDGKSS
ncbi:hypothetical protein L6164_013489 [Bauhinia variegata]|uniref:Uncharacterized protein n=1 Tax=Bauhinia variegata TaxID=167791 RepID=A0ACB9NG12_BAUVA|nr:hypothetical protein L6164_013489 [Bauhinia variegata]